MLDAMVKLGKMLLESGDGDQLTTLVQPAPPVTGKEPKVVLLDIDTVNHKMDLRPFPCNDSDRARWARELLWVGNAYGAAAPQWTATTNSLRYLLSQTIVNLLGKLPEDSSLYQRLDEVRKNEMMDLGPQSAAAERYRYVLDVERLLSMSSEKWQALLTSVRLEPNGPIHAKNLVPNLEKEVLSVCGISSNSVVLWSLCVNGQRIVDDPDYQKLIIQDKIQSVFDDAAPGRCSSCGVEGDVTPNFTRMKFKYYNTDKISFASAVDRKRFNRNLSLCSNCYTALLSAEAYVHGQMRSRIGHLRFYVIPELLGLAPKEFSARQMSDKILEQVNSMVNFRQISNLEDILDRQTKGSLGYVVNLLFHEWNNAELRLYNLVRDVPVGKIRQLRIAFRRCDGRAERLFGPRSTNDAIRWTPDFDALYHLIPVNRSNRSSEYRRLLQIFDALLTGQAVSYQTLMTSFCQLIEIRRFGRYETTNVLKPKAGMEISHLMNDMLMANVVLSFLLDLGQLADAPLKREELEMGTGIRPDADAFLQTVGYRPSQEALFWLGACVANIATAQWSNELKSMPILEKINYRGMSAGDVVRLVGKVEEAIRQYKLFRSTSENLFRMHVAFAQALDAAASPPSWKAAYRLTDEEAVFYVMSGFAYHRKQILSRSRKDKSDVETGIETLETEELSAAETQND